MPRLPPFLERLAIFGPPSAAGRPERPLRMLLVASLLLPTVFFIVASVVSYQTHFTDAQDRLERTLGMVHEHAIKVFETFEISELYLEELFNEQSDDAIRANEAKFSARLRNLQQMLPQLRDLWVIGGDGRPLVAGTVYPMPRNLDLSDRRYFSAHKNNEVKDTFISQVIEARAANTNFFALTRRRLAKDGSFAGVYLVSIAPEYFVNFYSQLPAANQGIAALLRADGAVLARYPDNPRNVTQINPNGPFLTAVRQSPQSGFVIGISSFDGAQRMFAYRMLPHNSVYVVTGMDTSLIRNTWLKAMSYHLIFGLPATLAMLGLTLLALRRTQREAGAYSQLHDETARRQNTEMALRQAQKMEAVGRLTGGIAHDFNNLLTTIIGNVDLASRRLKTDDDRITRSLTAVRQASQRAATLVQRLLSFSRQHPQEVKAVDVNRLVQGMSELLHRTLGETVTIETVLASGLWKSALDPNQLENAIINLAINARDAMPDGGQLTIETSNSYLDEAYVTRAGGDIKAGQYILIAVSDTGTGMNQEVKDKAFDPFFTTKAVGAGSGLGLSMVYGFVKQSGGHIQIYSEPGEGTSLKMYFPRLASEAGLPAWSGADPVEQGARASGHNELILLVEDDAGVRAYVTEALQDIGYRVVTTNNGANALKILQDEPDIALLFTDVVLPGGMKGRQLADKARETLPKLKVLFATGYTRNAIIHHGRLDPDVELLIKPFTAQALSNKVRQVLDS
ncbi:MAG: ATP-binding protein [Hyphomicrobiales bacterium]